MRQTGFGGAGIAITDASPTISNTALTDNEGSAVFMSGASYPRFSGLSASTNGADAITIDGATIAQSYTLGGPGFPAYRFIRGVTVNSGVVLTVAAGTTIKMRDALLVNGTLTAQGTANAPILFTTDSATPAKGQWGRLYFAPGSTNNLLDYVTVEYGGYFVPSIEIASSGVTIQRSTIRRTAGDGILVTAGTPTITNNNIVENDGNGLTNINEGATVNATCNWWGSPSGPAPAGTGQEASGLVSVAPWLTSPAPDSACNRPKAWLVYLPLTQRR